MEDLFSAAVYGAIGGGVGGLIGGGLGKLFSRDQENSTLPTIFMVAFVVLGINLAEPLLAPHIGNYLPKTNWDTRNEQAIAAAIKELERDPLFQAILEKDPSLAEDFRSGMRDILQSGGDPTLAREKAFNLGFNLTSKQFAYYLPRAQGADLIEVSRVLNEGLVALSESDPQFCYGFLYDQQTLLSYSVDEIKEKFGRAQYDKQQEVSAELVRGAYTDVPSYDEVIGMKAIERGRVALFSVLAEEDVGFLTGAKRPQSVAQAKQACDATIALQKSLLSEEDPVPGLRALYAGI